MDKILSIILPVYNVEEYIERCIRSLEKQDIHQQEYEIIVVNDGSPDNSREIVLQMMNEFNNVILIDQENRGVSMARNAGIARASGKYLLFVDPDDYVGENVFAKSISYANDRNLQIVYLGYTYLNPQGESIADVFNERFHGSIFNGTECYFLARGNGLPDPDRSCSIMFDRSFLIKNDLLFLSNVPYLEDGEFITRVLCLAERCGFYCSQFYKRTTRLGSATNSNLIYTERSIDGFIRASINLKKFKELHSEPQFSNFMNHAIVKFALLSVQACASRESLNQLNSTLKKLKDNNLLILELNGVQSTYYHYGRMYNISPYLYFLFHVLKTTWIKVSTSVRV